MYATAYLRGKDREMRYRIRSMGPGSGWEVDWEWVDINDRSELQELTAAEEDAINDAFIYAEGRTP
jgi:hypothetical protein